MENKSLIIGLVSFMCVVLIFGGVFYSSKEKTTLGSTGAVGDYVIKTSGVTQVVSAVPLVLHKIIFGTANDVACIADSASSSSGCTMITATVPQSFDMEMNLASGLTAYVTSTNGVIFITSPK